MEDIFNQIAAATRPQQASNFLNMFDEISENIPEAKGSEAEQAELEQKSFEWHIERAKHYTGSEQSDLASGGRVNLKAGLTAEHPLVKWGKTAQKIILKKHAILNMTEDGQVQYVYQEMKKDFVQTRWGNENEPIARAKYEEKTGYKVEVTGFTENPKCSFHGGSFDGHILGLVWDDYLKRKAKGIIEIKCHYDPVLHEMELQLAKKCEEKFKETGIPYFDTFHEYFPQFQNNVEAGEADFIDFISFDPRRKEPEDLCIIRVYRDEIFCEDMMNRVRKAKQIQNLLAENYSIEKAIIEVETNN